MAFVIKNENEDNVTFFSRDTFGKTSIIQKYIERGDMKMLQYHIKEIYNTPCKRINKVSNEIYVK